LRPDIRVIDDVEIARIFMSPTRGEIMKEMAVQSRSISQLSRTLGISPAAVHYHIKILEKAGLIAVTRVETVRNNLVEKFYSPTSACFMVVGEENSRKGSLPLKGRPEERIWIVKFEGMEEYLSGFDLKIKEGHEEELEEGLTKVMQLISSHAEDIGKGLFAQIDEGFTKAQVNKINSIAATIAPIAVAQALDDPKMIEVIRSLKAMIGQG